MEEQLNAGGLDVLGLATGSTMIPVYEKWVDSDLSFENVTTFNLDEYIGLNRENKNSYSIFMDQHLFSKKKFKHTYIPNGIAEDLDAECVAYEELLRKYPLDIQFLGIGENGPIAFNGQGTSFESVTHIESLSDSI